MAVRYTMDMRDAGTYKIPDDGYSTVYRCSWLFAPWAASILGSPKCPITGI